MIKTLLAQVKQYRSASIFAPVFTAGEVLMEVLIPFVTASMIDMGIEGVTLTMDMAMDYEINEMGDGVTVDVPDDLDSYTDMSELADTAA